MTNEQLRDIFYGNPATKVTVSSAKRKEFLLDTSFDKNPIIWGRLREYHFKNIGGGVWEMSVVNFEPA